MTSIQIIPTFGFCMILFCFFPNVCAVMISIIRKILIKMKRYNANWSFFLLNN